MKTDGGRKFQNVQYETVVWALQIRSGTENKLNLSLFLFLKEVINLVIDQYFFPSPEGITLQNVNKLNLLRLAPGGHVGRFCIWTESAFRKLDELYGTWRKPATLKVDYK